VGTFGDHLRREREMRGIGLDEIATATKISTRNLKALEDEKFNQLPGGIFNKGFVRAYAKFLGIDEEHIVAEYESASKETESAREEKFKAILAKPEPKKSKDDQEISLEPKSQWGTIAIIVLLAVLAYGGYNVYQRKKADREQQRQQEQARRIVPQNTQTAPPQIPTQVTPGSSTSPSTNNAQPTSPLTSQPATGQAAPVAATQPTTTQPAGTTSNPTPTPASQKTPSGTTASPTKTPEQKSSITPTTIDLKIKVNKESWVSIKADGKLIVSANLTAGTEKSVKAADKVEMVLGNAGGVEVSYNGKQVENLANGQDVRKITFTPSGYE
jgi:cytoskeleton protein RodZ